MSPVDWKLGLGKKLRLAALATAAFVVPVMANDAPAQWQIAAGGKMAFDVASVKQVKTRYYVYAS